MLESRKLKKLICFGKSQFLVVNALSRYFLLNTKGTQKKGAVDSLLVKELEKSPSMKGFLRRALKNE